MKIRAAAIALMLFTTITACPKKATMTSPAFSLATMQADDIVHGFRPLSLYVDDADLAIGGRFEHVATGFTLDLLHIESAPQAFIWVNTLPTSDKGEAHTQEHLLLGKGNKGRHVAGREEMALAQSSAFTMQWQTCYHFHTIAGIDAFWELLEDKLDALLHPDYSDEEIRREVRNFGVSEDPDGALRLEEKGTVYTEMVRSFESPSRRMFRSLGQMLYGASHPLALSSGGLPAALRELGAADIRAFHRANYHLGNMGMIATFPKSVATETALARASRLLAGLPPTPNDVRASSEADMPAPQMAPAGAIELVDYPHRNGERPGSVAFAWPATLELTLTEQILLEVFLNSFVGDETTNLYRRLIDTDSRVIDVGATGVWGWVSSDRGHAIHIGVSDVAKPHLDERGVRRLRAEIAAEIARVAAWPGGSPELIEFNQRVRSRIAESRRALTKFLNSPPGFGYRGASAAWLRHLHELTGATGFRKSLTMRPELDFVIALLSDDTNIWPEHLTMWGLREALPYGVASVANPDLIERDAAERSARISAEAERLAALYGTTEPAATVARYRADYERRTAELEAAEATSNLPDFVDTPPMTLDDQIDFTVTELADDVPLVVSTFANMTGATLGIGFSLADLPDDALLYLAAIPSLLTEVGIYSTEEVIAHDAMKERLRREILSLRVHFSTNFRTGRAEMVVSGAGNDEDETLRALEWMLRIMNHPDWRPQNLPRIRDLVDQMSTSLRNRMLGPEEYWVEDPARIFGRQDQAVFARTSSFLTQTHDLHRLKWRLKDAGEHNPAAVEFLTKLAEIATARPREELTTIARLLGGVAPDDPAGAIMTELSTTMAGLDGAARAIVTDAGKDLGQLLGDIPDDSLAQDWSYLCKQMAADLVVPPAQVLTEMHAARRQIFARGSIRLFAVGRESVTGKATPLFGQLVANLDQVARPRQATPPRFIEARLRQRSPGANAPRFVGLVNPSTQSGVFINSVPGYTYFERDDERLLDYLASNLYSGHGAHGIFMKTWAAGLAYSNGLRGSLVEGRLKYYAERCPELTQTLTFVVDQLRGARPDDDLADYALAQSFSSRVAGGYEWRGQAIAADLADGVTPALVRDFRARLRALHRRPDFAATLFARQEAVVGRLLPGYGASSSKTKGAVFFVVGPEAQLASYESYLRKVEGASTVLHRLYPRDYWIPADVD